jgi:Secretion system C-terminal sorting domain
MIRNYTLILFLALMSGMSMAQCPTCTPVFSTCPAAGGLCNKLDTAYAHHPFNKVINFYMPKVITDPALLAQCQGCSQIDLLHITVTGVSGLPTGVSYLLSNGGYYNVQGGDSMGCATFCGTPLLAGTYVVTVYLEADVTAIGTPIGNVTQNNNPQQYVDTLWVLPDTVAGVSSFTYGSNGSSACDSITISLNALLSAPQPNLTRYFWNIGGITSNAQSPGTFRYTNTSSTPDTIPVTLTTIFYNYIVKNVHIDYISGGYCGDIEELTCACISGADSPDPYIKFPLLGFNNSSNYVSNQCRNVNFDNLGLSIPLGTQTLAMEIWDKDNGPPFGSADDLIGSYNLNVLLGEYLYSNNNAYGYVEYDTIEGTNVTETLNVIVNPTPRVPFVIASKDSFCTNDSTYIGVDSASFYPGFQYAWYRDTVFLTANVDSGFYTKLPGKYHVVITNPATGCSVQSTSHKVSSFAAAGNPNLVFTGTQIFINPLVNGFAANWYYNGNLVTGQNGDILNYLGNGVYTAQIYNKSDANCANNLTPLTVNVNSIEEAANNAVTGLILSPNPNNGKFHLQFSSEQPQTIHLSIENMIGQVVFNRELDNFSGNFNQEMDLSELSKGVYLVWIETNHGRQNRKVVVQ